MTTRRLDDAKTCAGCERDFLFKVNLDDVTGDSTECSDHCNLPEKKLGVDSVDDR